MPLLEIKNLTLDFESATGAVRTVENVSLSVDPGKTLCLVGESGCGKTVTALSIARLLPVPPARYAGGQILLDGQDVLQMSSGELRLIRGGVVGYVFQEPATSLNPVRRVGSQILEALRLHRPEKATTAEVVRLLSMVGIPAPEARHRDYPFQMSGGMQQRAMIAMALAAQPKLLVADEPTTALDVTIQAQILQLLGELKRRLRMGILLITHNLGIVAEEGDDVAVMYAGQIVESAPVAQLLRQPLHPYTRALLASIPRLGVGVSRLRAIPGTVPRPGAFPSGCRFAPRCPIASAACSRSVPELVAARPDHLVRCPYWETDTPDVTGSSPDAGEALKV